MADSIARVTTAELGVAVAGFDYEIVSVEHRKALREDARQIRKRLIETTAAMMDIGERLERCHSVLPHGTWLGWLVAETGMSEQWSRNCINLFRRFSEQPSLIEELDMALAPTAIVRLASAPDAAYDDIMYRVREGERLRVKDVEDTIREHRQHEREAQGRAPGASPASAKTSRDAGRVALYQVQQARPHANDIADVAIRLWEELRDDSPDGERLRRLAKALKRHSTRLQRAFSDYLAENDLDKLATKSKARSNPGEVPAGPSAVQATRLPRGLHSTADALHMDHIVCLEDGKKVADLAAYLYSIGTTPEEYRTKWGLPPEYPMQAPDRIRREGILYEVDAETGRSHEVPETAAELYAETR